MQASESGSTADLISSKVETLLQISMYGNF